MVAPHTDVNTTHVLESCLVLLSKLPNIHGTLSDSVTVPTPKPYVAFYLDRHVDLMDHGYGYKFDIRQIRETGDRG